MIGLPSTVKIMLFAEAADMQKGFEGLGSLVLDDDIKDFFGSIDHERLLKLVARRISDKRVLKLLRQWLKVGVFEDGMVRSQVAGAMPFRRTILSGTILGVVFALALAACGRKAGTKSAEAETQPSRATPDVRPLEPLKPAVQADPVLSSVVRVHIRKRLYVGWGALFPCDISTVSGPSLPKSALLGVAVGSQNSTCPLGLDAVEGNDKVTVAVTPGEETDQYCGLIVEVGSQRGFYKIVAMTPES